MLLILGTIRLPAENLARARPAMKRMVLASRAEPGCLHYSYAEDVLEPGLVRVTERWRDRAALDAHFRTPHIAEWRTAWNELEIGDRALSLSEISEPEPI